MLLQVYSYGLNSDFSLEWLRGAPMIDMSFGSYEFWKQEAGRVESKVL